MSSAGPGRVASFPCAGAWLTGVLMTGAYCKMYSGQRDELDESDEDLSEDEEHGQNGVAQLQ